MTVLGSSDRHGLGTEKKDNGCRYLKKPSHVQKKGSLRRSFAQRPTTRFATAVLTSPGKGQLSQSTSNGRYPIQAKRCQAWYEVHACVRAFLRANFVHTSIAAKWEATTTSNRFTVPTILSLP